MSTTEEGEMSDGYRNLLAETIKDMASHGKAPTDVRWVRSMPIDGKYRPIEQVGTWDDFARIADFAYYGSFGAQEINDGVLIVGDDWWMERHEYDGSEWWDFKTLPTRPEGAASLTFLKKYIEEDNDRQGQGR